MLPWIIPAVALGTTLVNWALAYLHKHTMTHAERATLLTTLAQDAAAVIVAAFPGKPWADLVNLIIQRLLGMPGVPTQNRQALEGAASSALLRMGKAPVNGK